MRRKLRPRLYKSCLVEVSRCWTKEDLEEIFGLLPGEGEFEEEGDWWGEMEVEERLTLEGRCFKA